MDRIKILTDTMSDYAVEGLNSHSAFLQNEDNTMFSVVTIGQSKGQHTAFADLIVEIKGNFIVIQRDMNSAPLFEALVQNGIPRENIILAYAGEKIPVSVSHE